MADRTTVIPLIRLITLATGLVIGGGVSASVVEVNTQTLPVIGHPPVVTDVQFDNKTPAVNDTVKATPAITDEDGDKQETLYQWRLDGVDIPNATQDSYKLVPGDGNGKQLSLVVTPQTDPATTEPATGKVFTSSMITTLGSAPEALDMKIVGIPKEGETLTAHYTYYDADNDPEGNSEIHWYCADSSPMILMASGKNFQVGSFKLGCSLTFFVLLKSSSGSPNERYESVDFINRVVTSK